MAKAKLDQATQIRKGEELDIPALEKYLLQNLPGGEGELKVDQFPGGASNLTYLITLGEQELVLRRPPFGAQVKSGHDMGREYKVLSKLSKHYGKAPKPFLYTEDERILGASFYVMERVQGIVLRHFKGQAKDLAPETRGKIAESLVDTLVELHALDYEKMGLGDLGRPNGYAERQVVGWTKRYMKAKTHDYPNIEKLAKWLNDRIPTESGSSLIHNDYKYDNVVLDADDITKVRAVLDWEMCTLGDPFMDLGGSLAYWRSPNDPPLMKELSIDPSALPGNPTRAELLDMYCKKSGKEIPNPVFYFAFGLFKLAVIIQQIYYRYHLGFTKDERFAGMNVRANGLCEIGLLAIEKNKIDDLGI